jgi:hypothetical protein
VSSKKLLFWTFLTVVGLIIVSFIFGYFFKSNYKNPYPIQYYYEFASPTYGFDQKSIKDPNVKIDALPEVLNGSSVEKKINSGKVPLVQGVPTADFLAEISSLTKDKVSSITYNYKTKQYVASNDIQTFFINQKVTKVKQLVGWKFSRTDLKPNNLVYDKSGKAYMFKVFQSNETENAVILERYSGALVAKAQPKFGYDSVALIKGIDFTKIENVILNKKNGHFLLVTDTGVLDLPNLKLWQINGKNVKFFS